MPIRVANRPIIHSFLLPIMDHVAARRVLELQILRAERRDGLVINPVAAPFPGVHLAGRRVEDLVQLVAPRRGAPRVLRQMSRFI